MELMLQTAGKERQEGNEQVAKNVIAGVTGIFLIVPLFFIDPHNNNSVEEQAARNRYLKLQNMGRDRGCSDGMPARLDPQPPPRGRAREVVQD